jgi:hypothetical protein
MHPGDWHVIKERRFVRDDEVESLNNAMFKD